MKPPYSPLFFLFILPLFILLGGCETTQLPDPYDYRLELGSDLQGASIQVDMIGVPAAELERWRNKSITAYWEPGDADRMAAPKKTVVFSKDTESSQMLLSTDRVWQTWIQNENATSIVILADLPGIRKDAPGNADSRRIILPLAAAAWDERPQLITLRITGTGISAEPMALTDF